MASSDIGRSQTAHRPSRRTGNGEAKPSHRASHASRGLADQQRQIVSEARALSADVQQAAATVESYLRQQLDEQPLVTLMLAGAAGYVVGGGIASRLNRMVFSVAGRLVLGVAARQLALRLNLLRNS